MTSNKNIRLRIACSIYSGPMTLLIYSSSIILPTWDDFVCVCVCVCVLSYSGCNTPKILHVHKTSLVISCLNKSSLQGQGGCLDWKCSIFATQRDITLNAELVKNNCVPAKMNEMINGISYVYTALNYHAEILTSTDADSDFSCRNQGGEIFEWRFLHRQQYIA